MLGLNTGGQPATAAAEHAIDSCLEGLPHGLVLVDAAGRIVLCTQRARHLLGVEAGRGVEGRRAGTLLRSVARAGASRPRGWLAGLREALDRGEVRTCDLGLGAGIEVGLHPAPAGGWAVTLNAGAPGARPRTGSAEAARVDALTGLPNRLGFRERLEAALARLAQTGEPLAVLRLDLDRFKQVNDALGYAIGDALLRLAAERLRAVIGQAGMVARLGGGEFAVLHELPSGPEEPASAVERLGRRLIDMIGRSYLIDSQVVGISATSGAALGSAGDDPDRLLARADLALQSAKAEGAGSLRFFEPEMDARRQARRGLELDLRRALALREFQLHYQPQLNLETNRLLGCEALIRWQHRERGTVSPLDFIPLAEETGLIVPIGEWVVRTACKEAASWPDHVSVAVNLSPTQFKSRQLVEVVVQALAASRLAPHRLELEITEGVLLRDDETTLDTLHRLRGLGVRISMDDFGTGYSSLSYLRSFPFDKIKIDRSFVRDLSTRPDSNALIRAIAALGRSLGMATIAEGVETADQMRRIHAEGCTDIQGYLISRPVPAADIRKLLVGHPQAA